LKPILYVETNFVVGVAKGQDPEGGRLLGEDDDSVTLVFPTVCFMESFFVLNVEKKQWEKFHVGVKDRVRELKRNKTAPLAARLATDLEQSGLAGDALLREFEECVREVLDRLSLDAELIAVEHDIVRDCLSSDFVDDPTDNLILCGILWHARRHPDGPKAFVSNNHNDFGQRSVVALLEGAGVRYFRRTEAAVGWLRSQYPDQADA
jgi:hypothetical protein